MEQRLFIFILLLSTTLTLKAQNCDIQIQVLDDRYMFGEVEKMEDATPVKKMKVDFTSEYMDVVLPIEDQNYRIRVVNQNCQAYCTRAKRVRQLHSGDEKLVRNLFKDKQEEILEQIKKCEI